MDYSLLLGVHYPSRSLTHPGLEHAHSASLDGAMRYASPLHGTGGAAAPASPQWPPRAPGPPAGRRGSTMSDDDVLPPPPWLAAQQQQQQLRAAAAGANTPVAQQLGAVVGAIPVSATGAAAAAVAGLAAGGSTSGTGARNWELYSAAAEQEEVLSKIHERMQALGFSEQRMKVRVNSCKSSTSTTPACSLHTPTHTHTHMCNRSPACPFAHPGRG
jgi:hypothetical protein